MRNKIQWKIKKSFTVQWPHSNMVKFRCLCKSRSGLTCIDIDISDGNTWQYKSKPPLDSLWEKGKVKGHDQGATHQVRSIWYLVLSCNTMQYVRVTSYLMKGFGTPLALQRSVTEVPSMTCYNGTKWFKGTKLSRCDVTWYHLYWLVIRRPLLQLWRLEHLHSQGTYKSSIIQFKPTSRASRNKSQQTKSQ